MSQSRENLENMLQTAQTLIVQFQAVAHPQPSTLANLRAMEQQRDKLQRELDLLDFPPFGCDPED